MWTVMIVDDDPSLRLVLRTILELNGHQVVEAGTQEEALDVARTWEPDAITLDLHVGSVNGLDILRRLRQAGLNGFAVIVSGSIEDAASDLSKWKELRVFDVVDKPFKNDILCKKVEAAAEATRNEGRLCRFLDRIIGQNNLSLSARHVGSLAHG